MEEKGLQVFKFEDTTNIRTIQVDGELRIVAGDVMRALGYSAETIKNLRKNTAHVPEKWRGRYPFTTPGGIQELTYFTEQGLYFFLARSDKPQALPFQEWIAGEVVPSIRKTGGYALQGSAVQLDELFNSPDTVLRLAQNWKDEHDKRIVLEEKNKQLTSQNSVLKLTEMKNKPKVVFADAVATSNSSILVGVLAKLIKQNGVNIGTIRLFEWLRDNGYLMKQGSSWNMPTQRSMNAGLFEVKEHLIKKLDGSTITKRTPCVTGKGQLYFINKFLDTDDPLEPEGD